MQPGKLFAALAKMPGIGRLYDSEAEDLLDLH